MALTRSEVYQRNHSLVEWVEEVASRTRPERIVWCDGSEVEYRSLVRGMCIDGILIELNQATYPGCYLHRSDPADVARTEDRTFICTRKQEDAGPTNNWMHADEAKRLLWKLLQGSMHGRTMYVVPYLMGPARSPYSQVGVEITDSSYVAVSLKIMTRMGKAALERVDDSGFFVKGVHVTGNLDADHRYICHFPAEKLIISINSNYGGNALLSKKCHALRIASVSARDEGWLAEHMLIAGVESPNGEVTYLTGAFPSASGKTNLAMLKPPPRFAEWKVWTVGDDIAWMHLDAEGRLRAINPEAGFFGVAPGTSEKTNPNMMETVTRNTIFTNVALTPDGTPWWEGLTENPPEGLFDWQGRRWSLSMGSAAHPNSRFTAPISQSPSLSPHAEDPQGVPISAIIFGGRRAHAMPLVFEALDWAHGVLIGAMMKVEETAAATGEVGRLRHDPMAMLPFCGYNMAYYFKHWLSFASRSRRLPRIFHVNWFRRGSDGRFLWPGYSENFRIIKWIIDRTRGEASAVETPIGYVPTPDSLDMEGLDIPRSTLEELLRFDADRWSGEELESSEEFFKSFGERFPRRLWEEYQSLRQRISQSA